MKVLTHGLAVCVLASISITAGAQKTVAGWYQEELEVVATAGRPVAVRAVVRTFRAGYYTRVERVDEQLPQMAALEYLLTNASTHERYTVNVPNTYIRRQMLTSAESAAMDRDTSQSPTRLERTLEDLGSGGRLLGYDTRRVRERIASRNLTGPDSQLRAVVDTMVRVMWIATFAANPALAVIVPKPTRAFKAGDTPRGVVMRSEETHSKPRRRVTHLEVRKLERREIDLQLFELPAGYRRIEPTFPGKP